MPKRAHYVAAVLTRFTPDQIEAMDAARADDETRATFIRATVAAEIERRKEHENAVE